MKPFDIQDTAMILIDHQVGTNTWAKSTPLELLQRNVVILAKFAKGTGMPLVLTSSQETNTHIQGPLMPELEAIAPNEFAARIKRKGLVNAWEDEDFAKACRATGKRNFGLYPDLPTDETGECVGAMRLRGRSQSVRSSLGI